MDMEHAMLEARILQGQGKKQMGIDEILEDKAFNNGELIYERLVKTGSSRSLAVGLFAYQPNCPLSQLRCQSVCLVREPIFTEIWVSGKPGAVSGSGFPRY